MITVKKKIKINYEVQLLINSLLNDKIKKKIINLKKEHNKITFPNKIMNLIKIAKISFNLARPF
jgi:hypothetical protein